MEYELLTLRGVEILSRMSDDTAMPVIRLTPDTILSSAYYASSALLDQLKDELHLNGNAPDLFRKLWLYVNFESTAALADHRRFDRLFTKGFAVDFADGEKPVCFVPFLNSSSQSKRFIYGFIRRDLFAPMRERLDLGLPLEERLSHHSLASLAKLYAYRGLYSSDAVLALRGGEAEADAFFHEDSIIILPDDGGTYTVRAFGVSQEAGQKVGEVLLRAEEAVPREVAITCFDGVGLLTPQGRDLINAHLPAAMRGQSFQVRLPFFKGMLHTVDIRRFLRDNGVSEEHAVITDIFHRERDLYKANVIVTPSVFKLYGLLDEHTKHQGDVMRRYFEMVRRYHHGLYVIKTESSFRHLQYVPLNKQLIGTLDLSADELDSLVDEHRRQADGYSAETLLDPEKRTALWQLAERDEWMTLLLRQPAFLRDATIRRMLENHRVSRYHDVALGRIRVKGENRFLSGDLFHFLVLLLQKVAVGQPHLLPRCELLKRRRIRRGAVYLPGLKQPVKEIALLRNPHISRNEDVCVKVGDRGFCHYYDAYLGHLTGVVFVGHCSCIPAALGGADFDGDHVIVSYDERVIRACRKSGYTETTAGESELPFIQIPALKTAVVSVLPYTYVSPQVIRNTFSSRIGHIANAGMKIAAVEYDPTVTPDDASPSASLCTILYGTEIDGCKKGFRPHIDHVIGYSGTTPDSIAVVKEVEKYIRVSDRLEHRRYAPTLKQDPQGEPVAFELDGAEVSLFPNREHNAVTQLLYRWAKLFAEFAEHGDPVFPAALPTLEQVFPKTSPYPDEAAEILRAVAAVRRLYGSALKNRDVLRQTCAKNTAAIFMRLKGQYDDIDQPIGGISCRDRMERLQNELLDLCTPYTENELLALRGALFSEQKERFDPHTYWPYGQMPSAHTLCREILALPDADLLFNFHFEGYRLLYYLLDNVLRIRKEERAAFAVAEEGYAARYGRMAQQCFALQMTATDFEKKLASAAREDLYDLLSCDQPSEVIARLYPPPYDDQKRAFWKIFSVGDVLTALGGDRDAE